MLALYRIKGNTAMHSDLRTQAFICAIVISMICGSIISHFAREAWKSYRAIKSDVSKEKPLHKWYLGQQIGCIFGVFYPMLFMLAPLARNLGVLTPQLQHMIMINSITLGIIFMLLSAYYLKEPTYRKNQISQE